jgi:hypothetical protein
MMNEFSRNDSFAEENGLCRGCRWWQAEADCPGPGCPEGADAVIGLCLHDELTRFSLQVSGHSGCNRFEARERVGMYAVPVGAVGG